MNQFGLNSELYNAVASHEPDLGYIENLLQLGADPMGSDVESDMYEHILGHIFEFACEKNEVLECHIEEIMNLFFGYGMDISADTAENTVNSQ